MIKPISTKAIVLHFIVCCLAINFCKGQDNYRSIKNELDTQYLYKIGNLVDYWIDNDEDSFYHYLKVLKYLTVPTTSPHYIRRETYYNLSLGDFYYSAKKNLDSSIYFYSKNINLKDSLDYIDHNIFSSIFKLSLCYQQNQQWAKAYYYATQAQRITFQNTPFTKLRDSLIILSHYLGLKYKLGFKTDLLDSCHNLIAIINRHPNDQFAGINNITIAKLYFELKQDSFIHYLNKSHSALMKSNDVDNDFFMALNGVTKLYLKVPLVDSVLSCLNLYEQKYKLLKTYNPPKSQDHYLHYLEHKAHYHYLKKEYPKALSIIKPLYDSCKHYNNQDFIVHILPLLSKIYEKSGLVSEALAFERTYNSINDSINRTQMHLIYKTQYQDEMQTLQERIQTKDQFIALQGKNYQQRTLMFVTIIMGCLFFAGFLFMLRRSLKLKLKYKNEELEKTQSQHQLEVLASKISGIEEERKRLAIDLHDGVANELWALQLQLNHLSDTLLEEHVSTYQPLFNQYQGHLNYVIEDVRNVAKNLRPTLLIQSGLESAIWTYCERLKKHQSQVKIVCSIYQSIPRFEEKTELSIFRIVQEIIQNALKHAKGANLIDIQIVYSDDTLNITIEDNGCGMPTNLNLTKESNGLANIYDRVKLLKGEISYLSQIDKGTCFTLNFLNLETQNHEL